MVVTIVFCAFAVWKINKKVFGKPSIIRWLIGTVITVSLAFELSEWFWG